jgi:hypothetical protein
MGVKGFPHLRIFIDQLLLITFSEASHKQTIAQSNRYASRSVSLTHQVQHVPLFCRQKARTNSSRLGFQLLGSFL